MIRVLNILYKYKEVWQLHWLQRIIYSLRSTGKVIKSGKMLVKNLNKDIQIIIVIVRINNLIYTDCNKT